jgi:hypothetical protein
MDIYGAADDQRRGLGGRPVGDAILAGRGDKQVVGLGDALAVHFLFCPFTSAIDRGHVGLVVAFPGGGSERVQPVQLVAGEFDAIGRGV